MKRPTTPPQLSPQERLRYARHLLKAAATLMREAQSLGTMNERERHTLKAMATTADRQAGDLHAVEFMVNEHQSLLRARRSRKAA